MKGRKEEANRFGIQETKMNLIKIRGKKSRKAVGGFFESIMAMMVITVGLLLITSSLSLFSKGMSRDKDNSVLMEKCLNLRDKLILNESNAEAGSLRFSRISFLGPDDLELPSGLAANVSGFELNDEGPSLIFSINSSDERGKECVTICTPISVQHAPNDVRAGLLTICLWEE